MDSMHKILLSKAIMIANYVATSLGETKLTSVQRRNEGQDRTGDFELHSTLRRKKRGLVNQGKTLSFTLGMEGYD